MYQFSIQVKDHDEGFTSAVNELKEHLSSCDINNLLFHIYSTVFSTQTMTDLIAVIREQFQNSQIVCNTVAGSVLDYEYQPGIIISVKAFEYPTSHAEVHTFDVTDSDDRTVAEKITQFVQNHPWVKAIEIYHTTHNMNTTALCERLSELPEEIVVFGGIIGAPEVGDTMSYLADQSGEFMGKGILVIYYGGDDLHIKTHRMSGWKPINKIFTVTDAQDNYIKEIDGTPPYSMYERYLGIVRDDETFVMNALEFPLLCEDQNHFNIRNVLGITPEGSLMVASDVNVGTKLRICYADTATVVDSIRTLSKEIRQFTPDVISIVSCVTRSIIWQMKDYMPELQGFRSIASCHGYLSHGELLREHGVLNHHNTMHIAAAFREGDVKDISYPEVSLNTVANVPLVARLSTFISRITEDLNDMYSEVEHVATTDALTGIGNRYLFDDVVSDVSKDSNHADTKYLMMFDLNGLKFVNDTYGHNEGDALIKAASDAIASVFSCYGQCFRIGGDEFAVIANFKNNDVMKEAMDTFYANIQRYNKTSPYTLSMAMGYSPLVNAQGKMLSASDWKMTADINMYLDKTKFHAIKSTSLNANMSDFITEVMSLIDNKNNETSYHSVRVQRMAVMIAKLMQLDDEVIERVNLASYLHDIGRLGISDTILTSAGEYTKEGQQLLQQIPLISRRLLSKSEDTKPIAEIVYACHEQWDGGGYPEGISGDGIPLESRIIAVTNFIDMALHGWDVRDVLLADKCINESQKNAGVMFDPEIVSVVIANFGDIIKGDMTD